MRTIMTEKAPQPAGHYSQAVVHEGVVYVSGQLPIDPHSGEKCLGSIEDQTQQVLENVAAILEASGSSKQNVLKVSLYISDMNLWDRVNKVYSQFFGDHRPARVVVPAGELHYGFKIEIDAIAFVNSTQKI
ncbi:MAG: Rid family detoxifying hydrolase [candidate division KSB1 bacterium]|jgi:reactive intermediate/imine deaminase|nr:Rid family detoxifying hydrolase [candidate division KSB1 bacterium]